MSALLDPELDPLFWDNMRADAISAWHGHVPFAHWLVANTRPRSIVELGTHAGVSYAAFCQAVKHLRLPTRCTAVDTWAGDAHSGAYSEDVFAELSAFNAQHFAGFSRLLRKTFDAALDDVADGSVDLLHIDGFHTYEAVSHDFHSWRSKLSDRAVVLFHDTNEHERGFGVWRFWQEIRPTGVASLEFLHAHGLGVLLVGPKTDPALRALCAAPVEQVRSRFAMLGERHVLAFERGQGLGPSASATLADPPPPAAPSVDPALDAGTVHIAERFVAPPGVNAMQLPRDAVERGGKGCTVWLVSADGQDWRQGDVMAVPEGDAVTLAFAGFAQTGPQYLHLFVTDICRPGTGMPRALAALLGQRRAAIALKTMVVRRPHLPPTALVVMPESVPAQERHS